MHILVVGCGSIGQRHIKNLVGLGQTVSAVDSRADRRSTIVSTYPGVLVSASLERILRSKNGRGRPDGVVVAVPTAYHMKVAETVLEMAPVPLYIEKPLSHRLYSVAAVRGLLAEVGTWAMVGYCMRFHPCLVEARRLVNEEQAIGTPYHVMAECGQFLPDWHPWEDYRTFYMAKQKEGGGALLDLSHEVDYLRWMFGEVQQVKGWKGRLSSLEIDTDDCVDILMQMDSGVQASINLNLLAQPMRRRCRILGATGTVDTDLVAGTVIVEGLHSQKPFVLDSTWNRNCLFVDAMQQFLACLAGEASPFCDFEDGVRTLAVLDQVVAL